jgi:threonine synthase
MDSGVLDKPIAPLSQKRLEAAVATALKQLATQEGVLLAAAQAVYDESLVQVEGMRPISASLRRSLPVDHVEIIELATSVRFEELAPALIQSISRAIDLASADRMSREETMSAMENLIRSGRVELFSRGLML